jgi:hypothetical protein
MFTVAYAPDEILTEQSTRSAKYKWVIAVDTALGAGLMANAVACVAASTATLVEGLIARGGPDASGQYHPGLPWAGCTILGGPADILADIRTRALASDGVLVVDMPTAAQTHRTYDDYLAELATTEPHDLKISAFSIIGPRNRIDKISKRLGLLT